MSTIVLLGSITLLDDPKTWICRQLGSYLNITINPSTVTLTTPTNSTTSTGLVTNLVVAPIPGSGSGLSSNYTVQYYRVNLSKVPSFTFGLGNGTSIYTCLGSINSKIPSAFTTTDLVDGPITIATGSSQTVTISAATLSYLCYGSMSATVTNDTGTGSTGSSAPASTVNLGAIGNAAKETSGNLDTIAAKETAIAAAVGTSADAAYTGTGAATLVAALKGVYAATVAADNSFKSSIDIAGSVWIDKTATPDVYYIRRETETEGTGVIVVNWFTPAGVAATPNVANLTAADGSNTVVVNTATFNAINAGTGYAVGDMLIHSYGVDTNFATPTLAYSFWLNATSGAVMTAAPLVADYQPASAGNSAKETGGNLAAISTATGTVADVAWSGVGNSTVVAGIKAISATLSAGSNITKVAGVTVLAGSGAVGTGAQRIAVGTDTATIAGSAPGVAGTPSINVVTVQGITGGTELPSNVTKIGGNAVLTGTGATGTGSARVTIATDTATLAGSAPGVAGTPSTNVVSVQGVVGGKEVVTDLAKVAGTAAVTGVGVATAGSLRVTNAIDASTIAGSAPGAAGTPSVSVVTVQGITGGTNLPTNQAMVAGTAVSVNTGTVNAGSQRVAVAMDSATIAGSAPGLAGAPSTNVISAQGVTGGKEFTIDHTKVAGTAILTGTGNTGAGSERVTIAIDPATVAGSAPGVAGTPSATVVTVQGITGGKALSTNTATIANTAVSVNAGTADNGTQRIAVAVDTTTLAGSAPGTAGTPSVNVVTVQGATGMKEVAVNTAKVNGVVTDIGTGASGLGTQRVAVSNDSKVQVWDGANAVTVKAASTSPAAADTAVVVSISPNSAAPVANTITDASSTIGTSSGVMLAANAAMRNFEVSNPNASGILYLNTSGGTASPINGHPIFPGGYYTPPAGMVPSGNITIIGSAAGLAYVCKWY